MLPIKPCAKETQQRSSTVCATLLPAPPLHGCFNMVVLPAWSCAVGSGCCWGGKQAPLHRPGQAGTRESERHSCHRPSNEGKVKLRLVVKASGVALRYTCGYMVVAVGTAQAKRCTWPSAVQWQRLSSYGQQAVCCTSLRPACMGPHTQHACCRCAGPLPKSQQLCWAAVNSHTGTDTTHTQTHTRTHRERERESLHSARFLLLVWAVQVDATRDALEVQGRRLAAQPAAGGELHYFAVNKPPGYICSSVSDRAPGKRAVDLLQPWLDGWQQQHKVGTGCTGVCCHECSIECTAVAGAAHKCKGVQCVASNASRPELPGSGSIGLNAPGVAGPPGLAALAGGCIHLQQSVSVVQMYGVQMHGCACRVPRADTERRHAK